MKTLQHSQIAKTFSKISTKYLKNPLQTNVTSTWNNLQHANNVDATSIDNDGNILKNSKIKTNDCNIRPLYAATFKEN
jgi:hypothetical protein